MSLLELPINMGQYNVKHLKVNKNVGATVIGVVLYLIFFNGIGEELEVLLLKE